jgi:hypothetical protein
MVGLGIKNVFYDYLQSDYGNIPDIKIKIDNLSDIKTDKLIDDIISNFKDTNIDILKGYEDTKKVSILDSEELLLTDGLELFIKGVRFDEKIDLSIDTKHKKLKVEDISYDDRLYIKLNLDGLKIEDKKTIKFLSLNDPIDYNFCYDNIIKDDTLTLQVKKCKDKIDLMLETLANKKDQDIKVELDGVVSTTKIIYSDPTFKSLVLKATNQTNAKNISLKYQNTEISNDFVESFEIDDGEIIINFYQDKSMVKNYKLFLSKILRNYINYHRMILKLNLHTFASDDENDKEDKQLIYLNELTDLLDLIFAKDKGNLAISSTHLAEDLNNFAVLDNFNITSKDLDLLINIRSTVQYNPEKLYDKNIIIINQNILEEQFKIVNKNNYIDIYSKDLQSDTNIQRLNNIVKKYDKSFKILVQGDIIPSIKPKKFLFDSVVVSMAVFILVILFIAMYIILRQFYSNFNSELALLKLYGSKVKYQMFVNLVSFLISIVIIYIFMIYQEDIINTIMLKYFFIEYKIDIFDYYISIMILFVYIIINYFLESKEINKLNLIKGQ